ncbi:MAG: MFS transporter, partial [Pseudomonadales bacterium]|nr:MFS transporter [Pseudomonadales bacterium]
MLPAPPPRSAFPWYLASSGLWMAGISLQGFLFTWLLIGVLETPAAAAGAARSIAEFPPLLVLLLGGLLGDRIEGRRYLGAMHLLMALPPLLIAAVYLAGLLNYWWVVVFGILTASIQALSDPARQSALSRVALLDVQRAVTVMTVFTSLVGIGGIYLGGNLERLGLGPVLLVQSGLFLLGLIAVAHLPRMPIPAAAAMRLREGLQTLWQVPLIRNIIGLNLLSSLFNAGAYIIAIPFIVKAVYLGGAEMFATVMIVFTAGSVGSNILLLFFMPLLRPGRLFLYMQLTRIVVLGILMLQPEPWLFYFMMFCWGLNMGVTTTLVRATVQELAPPAARAQILS